MWILVLCFVFIILFGISKQDKNANEIMSKDNLVSIRGICAIEIMLGHIGLPSNTGGSIYLFPFRKAGILVVGCFLFFSGLGLIKSMQKQKDYFDKFIIKKCIAILVPAYLVYLVFFLPYMLGSRGEGVSRVWKYLLCGQFYHSAMWYVFELLLLYVLFFVLFRKTDNYKKSLGVVAIVSVVFIFAAHFMGLVEPWYGSTMCFSLGLFYGLYENKLSDFLQKNYLKCFAGSIFIFLLSLGVFFIGEDTVWGVVVARNIAALSFTVIMIMLLYKVKLSNFISNYCGKISYEIYLVHFYMLIYLKPYFENKLIYAFAVVILTIIVSAIMNKVHKKVCNNLLLMVKRLKKE